MTSGVALGIYEKALVANESWADFFPQVLDGGFSFCDLSVDETPARAARLTWNQQHRRAVRHAAERAGVQVGGICLSLHRSIMPGSADPQVRANALEVYHSGIQLAHDLHVSVVQVAGYYAYYEPQHEKARDRYLETLHAAVPAACRAGVVLGIENVDGHDIASINDAMAVVDEIGSPWVQLYPDVGNIAEHGGDATDELRAGAGHMVALHVKDVLPGQPRRVPFGTGVADFDAAFCELKRQRWSGRIMLEMWNDDAPDSMDRCRRAREFVTAKLTAAGIALATVRSDHAAARTA